MSYPNRKLSLSCVCGWLYVCVRASPTHEASNVTITQDKKNGSPNTDLCKTGLSPPFRCIRREAQFNWATAHAACSGLLQASTPFTEFQLFLFYILFLFLVCIWSSHSKKKLNCSQVLSHTNLGFGKIIQIFCCTYVGQAFLAKRLACFTTSFSSYSILELNGNGPRGFSTRASRFTGEENDTQGGEVSVRIPTVGCSRAGIKHVWSSPADGKVQAQLRATQSVPGPDFSC